MAAHNETSEMKVTAEHAETAESGVSSNSPVDVEKRGDFVLSRVATQDDTVVTAKTWAVVAVRSCNIRASSFVSNKFFRCSPPRTAYRFGQYHTSAPSRPRSLPNSGLLQRWALGMRASSRLQGNGDMLTYALLGSLLSIACAAPSRSWFAAQIAISSAVGPSSYSATFWF